jgi:hypothetical protein
MMFSACRSVIKINECLLTVWSVDNQANALPLYTISPIEAALVPLGLISNSSCAFLPFIDWILKSERAMEYRIGAVRTMQYCILERARQKRRTPTFLLVKLENGRQIENWLKIEGGSDS